MKNPKLFSVNEKQKLSKETKTIELLLCYAMERKLGKVKEILINNPSLAFEKGKCNQEWVRSDLAREYYRDFQNISAFEIAYWALSSGLLNVILDCIYTSSNRVDLCKAASKQYDQLRENGIAYQYYEKGKYDKSKINKRQINEKHLSLDKLKNAIKQEKCHSRNNKINAEYHALPKLTSNDPLLYCEYPPANMCRLSKINNFIKLRTQEFEDLQLRLSEMYAEAPSVANTI